MNLGFKSSSELKKYLKYSASNTYLRRTPITEFKKELEADVLDENGLTHKDNKFLDILFDECKGNVREAMKLAGLTGGQHSLTKRLEQYIKERAANYLAANTAKAAISLVDTLDDPNQPGLKNSIAAAKEILDRGGVSKKEEAVVKEQNFMFILPPKKYDEDND